MKIIDRVKAYIGLKKEPDSRLSDDPLDGTADPAPAQPDGAGLKQDRDDESVAVSTADETPEPEPASESATAPAGEPTIEPVAPAATEPTTKSTTEPATEPVAEATAEPATEPTAEPVAEAAAVPGACPRCGATGDAPCTTPSGKATKNHKGRPQ